MKPVPIQLTNLERGVKLNRPDARFERMEPFQDNGRWWIDVHVAGHETSFSWIESRGFEFYPGDERDFGLKPETWTSSVDDALRHVLAMFRSWGLQLANKEAQRIQILR